MGSLAKALGKSFAVTVGGIDIAVNQLPLDDLFDCMKEAFRQFDTPPASIDNAAQIAIETGKVPLKALPVLIAKACPTLDADDLAVLTQTGNLDTALLIVAASMGEDPEETKKRQDEALAKATREAKAEASGKKRVPKKKRQPRSTGAS